MTTALGVAVVAAKTSPGNQDITTTDLGGETPIAALFLVSRAASNGAVTSDGQISFGCTDGTTQLSYANFMKGGLSPSYGLCWYKAATDCCLCTLDNSTTGPHSQASFVSFITNGVRVNWTTAGGEGWLITALLFAGTDWTAKVGTATLSGAPTDVNVGFDPNCVFSFNTGSYSNYGSIIGPAGLQSTLGWWSPANSGASCMDQWIGYYNAGIGGGGIGLRLETGSPYVLQISAIANGFQLAQTQLAFGAGDIWGYLALKYTGIGTLIGGFKTINLGTAGDLPITGLGAPAGGFLLLQFAQDYNAETATAAVLRCTTTITNYNITKTGGWSIGASGVNVYSQATPPFNQFSAACEDSITMLTYTGAVEFIGSVASYDTDGFTINVSTPISGVTDPSFRMAFLTVINSPAPPPPPPPPPPPKFTAGFIIERLDNRIWPTVEDCWCVDCGFELFQPNYGTLAELGVSTPFGAGILTGVTNLVGGQGYSSATTAEVIDHNGLGPGTGAVPVVTITGGVITAITFSPAGANYVDPAIVFNDPENTGSGASATITMDNSATWLSAPVGVFQLADVGSVIRAGYGVAVVTGFISTSSVTVNVLSPIVQLVPNAPPPGIKTMSIRDWTMTKPITQFYLPQLVGFDITGLADGQIIPIQTVPANGLVTLAQPASQIIVGLPFQAQLQSTYLDAGEPTIQAQRKKIAEVSVRVEQSAGFQIGGNQPDGSVQSPQTLFEPWQNMADAPNPAMQQYNAPFQPLFTGDIRVPIQVGFGTRGQVAVQQLSPLPLQVLDYVPEVLGGDKPAQEAPAKQRGRGGGRGGQKQ